MTQSRNRQGRMARRAKKAAADTVGLSIANKAFLAFLVLGFVGVAILELQLATSRHPRQSDGIVREVDLGAGRLTLDVDGQAGLLVIDLAGIPTEERRAPYGKGAHVCVTYRDSLWGMKRGMKVHVLEERAGKSGNGANPKQVGSGHTYSASKEAMSG